MSLSIIKPGMLDTLQDCGRYGYAAMGINPGGVMDSFAAGACNALAGNKRDEAVLELHFPASQILFQKDALISICGADLTPSIHGETIPMWQPVVVRKNALLHFQQWKWGSRAYLGINAGFNIAKWLNSYSTNLKAAAGGYCGRALAANDILEVNEIRPELSHLLRAERDFYALPWGVHEKNAYNTHGLLVLPGPEWPLLDEDSKNKFTHSAFRITQRADRMGYLLQGQPLQLSEPFEMVSSGVDFGTIQLLPDGQLMCLMADHQTTGGYPRIGNIIRAHLPNLAQLTPGSEVHFMLTDMHTAEQLLFSQERDLRIIEWSCQQHINQLYASHRS